jgi:hypothetical protein
MNNIDYQRRKELFQNLELIQNELEQYQDDYDTKNELQEEEHCLVDKLKELGFKNLEYWGGRVFD